MFKFRKRPRWFVPPPKDGYLYHQEKKLLVYDCVRTCGVYQRPYLQAIYKEFKREMKRKNEKASLIEFFSLLQELVGKKHIDTERGQVPTRHTYFRQGMRFSIPRHDRRHADFRYR